MPAGQAPGCLHPASASSGRSPAQLHPSRDPQPVSNANPRRQALPSGYNWSLFQLDSGLGFDASLFNCPCAAPRVQPGQTHPSSAHSPWAISHPRLCLSHRKIPVRKRAARPMTNSEMCNAAPQPKGAGDSPHFALKPKALPVTAQRFICCQGMSPPTSYCLTF